MRKALLALLLALLPCSAFAAWTPVATCAFGQASTDTNGFTTSGASCDSTGATAIVVLIGISYNVPVTVTSSTGGTLSCGAVFSDSIGPYVSGKLCVFEVPTGASGNTFTIICTACSPGVVVKAFSGSTGCNLIDQTANPASNFDVSESSNPIISATTNLLIIEALVTSDTGASSPDSVFAGHQTTVAYNAATNLGAAMAYAVVNSGSFATTWSIAAGPALNLTSASSFFATGSTCGGAATPPFIFIARK